MVLSAKIAPKDSSYIAVSPSQCTKPQLVLITHLYASFLPYGRKHRVTAADANGQEMTSHLAPTHPQYSLQHYAGHLTGDQEIYVE